MAWLFGLATVSALVQACRRSGVDHSGKRTDGRHSWSSETWAPRLVALGWLFASVLAEDATTRLVAAVFLACSPHAPLWETCSLLTLILARQIAVEGYAPYDWVPWLLLLCRVPCLPCAARRESVSAHVDPAPPQTASDVVRRHPGWSPPRNKEAQVFQNAFNVEDTLLAVYPCAVSLSEVSHHGHLYISEGHLSFYGVNVGGAVGLQFHVPHQDVGQITCGQRRDTARLVLKEETQLRMTHNNKASVQVLEIELEGCEVSLSVLAALVAHRDNVAPTASKSSKTNASSAAAKKAIEVFATDTPFEVLSKEHVSGFDLEQFCSDFAEEEWRDDALLFRYLGGCGTWDMEAAPWLACEGPISIGNIGQNMPSVMARELKMQAPCPPAPMCPKSTRLIATVGFLPSPASDGPVSRRSVTVLASKVSLDVPFGEKFGVQEKLDLVQTADGVDVTHSARVVFFASCGLLQSKIRSSALVEVRKASEVLMSQVRCASSDEVLSDGQSSEEEEGPSCVEERVWELQRRTTPWSMDWFAPFLPHDGSKRWRWVDDAFRPHPGLSERCSRKASAAAETPPMEAPSGWRLASEWQLQCSQDTDAAGWQYALDFYQSDSFWFAKPFALNARRRLWTRTIKREIVVTL